MQKAARPSASCDRSVSLARRHLAMATGSCSATEWGTSRTCLRRRRWGDCPALKQATPAPTAACSPIRTSRAASSFPRSSPRRCRSQASTGCGAQTSMLRPLVATSLCSRTSGCRWKRGSIMGIASITTPSWVMTFVPRKAKKEIKVLRFDNKRGYGLDPCPSLLREQFFEAYSDSFDLNSMDFFICSHPVANCELYIPFGRPIIIYATTRLEFGRHDQNIDWRSQDLSEESPKRFQEWVRNLQALAKDPRNIVAANNAYDAAYIEYFTGIKALYIPSWCGGDASSPELIGAYAYQPKRMRVLIIPYRTNLEFYPEDIPSHGWPDHSKRNSQTPYGHPILKELADVMRGGSAPEGLVFASIHWEYGHEFSSPAVFKDHPAVVFLPYQFSTMSFFEAYRQSVPMLVPSRELLLKWVSKYGLMWERVYGDPARPRDLPRSPLPNPNSFDSATVAAWLDTHDFFQGDRFPHLLHFSSWEHAIQLLQSTDLAQVGLQMHLHNQREYVRQRHEWQQALVKARAWADASRGAGRRPGVLDRGHQSPANVSFALHSLYGLPPLPPDPKPGCAALREEWERGGAPKVKRKKGPDKCHA
mmetsp:Transcript_45347/g.145434  ORF Transcript_45347/g.145434 Transcript_45347/m.145434 type:complete len:590 (-) Transcript_45347:39-1808(-)